MYEGDTPIPTWSIQLAAVPSADVGHEAVNWRSAHIVVYVEFQDKFLSARLAQRIVQDAGWIVQCTNLNPTTMRLEYVHTEYRSLIVNDLDSDGFSIHYHEQDCIEDAIKCIEPSVEP